MHGVGTIAAYLVAAAGGLICIMVGHHRGRGTPRTGLPCQRSRSSSRAKSPRSKPRSGEVPRKARLMRSGKRRAEARAGAARVAPSLRDPAWPLETGSLVPAFERVQCDEMGPRVSLWSLKIGDVFVSWMP